MLRPGPATKNSGIVVEFALPMTIVQRTLHVEFASVSCGDEWLASKSKPGNIQLWQCRVTCLMTGLRPWECSSTTWNCCRCSERVHPPPLIKIILVDNPSRVDVVIPPVEINDFLQRVCSMCVFCCHQFMDGNDDAISVWECGWKWWCVSGWKWWCVSVWERGFHHIYQSVQFII